MGGWGERCVELITATAASLWRCQLPWPSELRPLDVELNLTSGTWRRTLANAWLVSAPLPEATLSTLLAKIEKELLFPPSSRDSAKREWLRPGLGWEGSDAYALDVAWEWDHQAAWRQIQWPPLPAYFSKRLAYLHSPVPTVDDVLALDVGLGLDRLQNAGLIRELLPGVWHVGRLVNDGFLLWVRDELQHLGQHAVDIRGLQPLFRAILARLQALFAELFHHVGKLDHSFAFLRSYEHNHTDFRLDRHEDSSALTVNLAVSDPSVFLGSELNFCGHFGDADYRQYRGQIDWHDIHPGGALFHLGSLRHGVAPIRNGARHNLILWGTSSTHAGQGVSPGLWETAMPPSPECVSLSSDADACTWEPSSCKTVRTQNNHDTNIDVEDLGSSVQG
ncbi:unnamed protein product [Polarella glacialis]|uniref:Fe2OG dioxygenase domain-containing protein n=1 Tax=Polarella glacialis TaxID=89957 RepID=A0A813IW74_POLGL|nr:unnamed protein product [Polarella glacialis]